MVKNKTLLIIGIMVSLFLCVNFASGEEASVSDILITANFSVVTAEENGAFLLALNDTSPDAEVLDPNQSIRVFSVNNILPKEKCTAAIILANPEGNRTVFMAEASDPVYIPTNGTLSFQIKPLKYYDGKRLVRLAKEQSEIVPGNYPVTKVYLEYLLHNLENDDFLDSIPPEGSYVKPYDTTHIGTGMCVEVNYGDVQLGCR